MSKNNPVDFEPIDSFSDVLTYSVENHDSKNSVYNTITKRIIDLMNNGIIPWSKPWNNKNGVFNLPHNFFSDKPYRGINLLLLSCAGYQSSEWLTKKQILGRHGKIKDGELPMPVVFFAPSKRFEKNYFFLKTYGVYNIEQTEGIKPIKKRKVTEEPEFQHEPIEIAESIVADLINKPGISIGNTNEAKYSIGEDKIYIPGMEQYRDIDEFYSTLFHELIHSTGSKNRLKRSTLINRDHENYSKEELVAELGSAFLCAHCGISSEKVIENQAAYINGWLKAISGDNSLVVSAASLAQKAVSWIFKNSAKKPSSEVEKETELAA